MTPRAWLPSLLQSAWSQALGIVIALPMAARAHEGLPYAIIDGHAVPGYVVSVWADPDVGTAAFFVILEPTESAASGGEPQVEIWTQPRSQRLARTKYQARRQPLDRVQYLAELKFDRAEIWIVEVVLTWPMSQERMQADVEVTPDGANPWAWVIYLAPCLLLGLWWIRSLLRPKTGRKRRELRADNRL